MNQEKEQKQQNEKLLRLKSGYNQHASLNRLYDIPSDQTSRIFNTLWQLKNTA